jgi:hypothetical protein
MQLKSVFANGQHRPEREAVTISKPLIGFSLTQVKGGTVHDNLEACTCNSFGLFQCAGIQR